MKRQLFAELLLLSMNSLCQRMFAQTSELKGVVSDSSGAVLPNATVILLNSSAIRVVSTTTQGDGTFVLRDLASGMYTVPEQL
jgi:Carboxypeptidase regulatory-like domain